MSGALVLHQHDHADTMLNAATSTISVKDEEHHVRSTCSALKKVGVALAASRS